MTVVTHKFPPRTPLPLCPEMPHGLSLNGVMTMLKTLAAVAAGTVLVTIAFAKFARGIPHQQNRSHFPDHIG